MIGEAILSLLSGGLTGVIGSAVSKFGEYKTRKLELDNQVAMANIETQHIELETRAQVQIAERESEAQEQSAADSVLSASYKVDAAAYLKAATGHGRFVTVLMGIVDFIRGLMRPSITLYLVGLTTWIAYVLYHMLQQFDDASFDGYEALQIWGKVIDMVLYLTTAAVLWWFGSRPSRR